MVLYVFLLSGAFMGWSLGSNDAANAFGTAVSTGVIKYKTAVTVIAVFVIIGSIVSGSGNIEYLCKIAISNKVMSSNTDVLYAIQSNTVNTLALKNVIRASIILLCAGLTVFIMTYMKLPVSANQSTVGAIIGWGLHFTDFSQTEVVFENIKLFARFAVGWVLNPVLSALFAYIMVKTLMPILIRFLNCSKNASRIIKIGYIISGIAASYSMGANSSSNVTALYYDCFFDGYKTNFFDNARVAVTFGGIAMAIGVLTYSKKVMMTVGDDIVKLNQSDGFIVILAMSVSILFIEQLIKIPVSSSQAVVGAIVGAGLVKGKKYVDFSVLKGIAGAWITSPLISGIVSYVTGIFLCGFFN